MYNRTVKKLAVVLDKPSLWGILYLLAFVLYALIFQYWLPEKSFFHATLQHEPKVQERSTKVLQKLWSDYSHLGPKKDGDCESLSPLAKSINLNSLRMDGDDVSFSAIYILGVWPTEYSIEPRIHFSLERNFDVPYRLPPGKGRGAVFKELRVDGVDTSPWGKVANPLLIPRCLFPTLYDQRLPRNVALLDISVPLDQEIQELADDLRGVPRRESDGLGRMLYLSASTITTTGFGDIVPLTNWARGLVTSESIVGVIFHWIVLERNRSSAWSTSCWFLSQRALTSFG
jgi:hypothetical protein